MAIEFTSDFIIGVRKIDDQHKKLINIISEFQDECENGNGKSKIREIIFFLVEYAIEHFKEEECYMEKNKYPKYSLHKKQHQYFIDEYIKIINHIKEKDAVEDSDIEGINKFAVDWILNHIKVTDMELGKFLRGKM